MCICIPNMKFLCLTMWQGEVCADDDDADDDDANTDADANDDDDDDDRQSMIVSGSLVDKPNEPEQAFILSRN